MEPRIRRPQPGAAGRAVALGARRAAAPDLARGSDHRTLQDERRLFDVQHEVLVTRRQVQSLLAPSDLLLTGGVTIQSRDGVRSDRRHQQRLRPGARRPHPRPLRQGPSRPLRRISADAASLVGDRPVAARARRPRLRSGPGPQSLDIPGVGRVGFQLCYEIIFSGEVVDPGAAGRSSSSIRPTTPGSAPGARPAPRPGAAARARGS